MAPHLDYDSWARWIRYLDHQKLTCPGGHTEKGGWRLIWSLDYVVATFFPEHRPIYQALYLHEQVAPTIEGLQPLPEPLPVDPDDDWKTNYDR